MHQSPIPQAIIDFVESQNWDEDTKQDLYIQLLELGPFDEGFVDLTVSEIRARYYNLKRNNVWTDRNRERLIAENVNTIRKALAMEGEETDPAEVLEIEEQWEAAVKALSPLLLDTLERVIIGGESPEDLAEEEGMKPNAIYQRVWQVKQQLRGIIND